MDSHRSLNTGNLALNYKPVPNAKHIDLKTRPLIVVDRDLEIKTASATPIFATLTNLTFFNNTTVCRSLTYEPFREAKGEV